MRVVIINLIISDLMLYALVLISVIFFFSLLFYFRSVLISSFALTNLASIFYTSYFDISNNKSFSCCECLIARLMLDAYA